MPKILFIKPPDRFLENEFVYQQLGPHFLQSYLEKQDIESDILVLFEPANIRENRIKGLVEELTLEQLHMLFIPHSGSENCTPFNKSIFENYDFVGVSVMTPQANDAYLLSKLLNSTFPHVTSIIGGSHPRYYKDSVASLSPDIAFDFIIPQDGFKPIHQVVSGKVMKKDKAFILIDNSLMLDDIPPPTRPISLMKRYNFEIAGVPSFHTITALGCPFSCNFCESGRERLRLFPEKFIVEDLENISKVHDELGHDSKGVMFFDDVGLMNPKQIQKLANLVSRFNFTTWRAFTHAYLVTKYKEDLLGPFKDTGGRRIGLGLETGSQRSLNLINKRNGEQQVIEDHYEAVKIANRLGIAVDAFTMIFPWEDEKDLKDTTEMIKFISQNEVCALDKQGRQMKNHVDSTIMSPYQGTAFYDMITAHKIAGVRLNHDFDPSIFYYKGMKGGSGWPYKKTRLPKERYIEEQNYRNSFRPKYR